MPVKVLILAVPALLLPVFLGACAGNDDLAEGGGIAAVRSSCPTVGVPAATGDVTIFDPPASRDAAAIDVTAMLTDVRSTCTDAGDDIVTTVTFQVQARRVSTAAARDLTLPYFIAVVRGGNAVTSKRIGQVALRFEAGQARASATGTATANVNRAAATLPEEIRERLTKKRKAGDSDAAIDPLATPDVRQAVLRSTFEALVGFQLSDEQLRYNATR